MSLSADSSYIQRQDSSLKKEEVMSHTCRTVEFIESGGMVSVIADGSLVLTGVTSVHYSGFEATSGEEENYSSEISIQSKDSVVASQKTEIHSESNVKTSGSVSFSKWIAIISVLLLILLLIILIWFRRIR